MGRVNLFVSVLLMLSAISLVTARYQARQLFVELDSFSSIAPNWRATRMWTGWPVRSCACSRSCPIAPSISISPRRPLPKHRGWCDEAHALLQ